MMTNGSPRRPGRESGAPNPTELTGNFDWCLDTKGRIGVSFHAVLLKAKCDRGAVVLTQSVWLV